MSLLGYSLSSGITLLILSTVYFIMVRNTTHFALNRFCLVCILIISMIEPFISLPDIVEKTSSTIESGEVIAIPAIHGAQLSSQPGNILKIIGVIYIIGVSLMVARTLANLVFILYLRHTGTVVTIGEYTVRIHTHNGINPMSWGGDIYLPKQLLNCDATELEMILEHENAHRRYYHWMDLLLSNIVLAINWYNPAAWYIQHELINVHEFEADSIASEQTQNSIDYQLLLIKRTAGSRFHAITDSLNHSSLKKRITMMMKNRSKNSTRLRSLSLLPAIAAALVLTDSSCVKSAQTEISQAGTDDQIKVSEVSTTNDTIKGTLVVPNETDSTVYNVTAELKNQSGVDMAEILSEISKQMKYPEEAIEKNIQGKVLIEAKIDEQGRITDAKIKEGVHEMLDKEALAAVNKIIASGTKFKPVKNEDGQPFATVVLLPVTFKLLQ